MPSRIRRADSANERTISPANDQPTERLSTQSAEQFVNPPGDQRREPIGAQRDQRARMQNALQADQPIVPSPNRSANATRSANKSRDNTGRRTDQPSAADPASAPIPTIRVTIGRIEVRSTPIAPAPAKRSARPGRSALSLDEYLKRDKSK